MSFLNSNFAHSACIDTGLLDAVKQNEVSEVKELIQKGVCLDAQDEFGNTALHLVARKQDSAEGREISEILIHAKANLEVKNSEGETPLIILAHYSHGTVQMMKSLIQAGVQINAQDMHGRTAFFVDVFNLPTEVAHLLMHAGADINLTTSDGTSPLQCVLKGRLDDGDDKPLRIAFAHELIQAGAKISTADRDGVTPLMETIYDLNRESALELIQQGAKLNEKTKKGVTALLIASNRDFFFSDVIDALLKAGADVNLADQEGDTPLMRVSEIETFEKYLHAGANPNAQRWDGNTVAMYIASGSSSVKWFILLHDHGANFKIKNRDGETAYDRSLHGCEGAKSDVAVYLKQFNE